ncbi:hypothetical protein ACOJUR_14135 [Alicyclobacillus tolerans]|uniref:hypothetical protein n=1 Tax=Alicyclobacillus tolerans TaxID=90970 RepID=UPI003B77D675
MAYYGVDTNTSTSPCGVSFYIGQIGYGTTSSMENFNTSAADSVGTSRTWSYWYVNGPQNDPNYSAEYSDSDAANWGQLQAQEYTNAWVNNTYVGGVTLFADIEQGNNDEGGWLLDGTSNSYRLNYYVYLGFIEYCKSFSGTSVGVYSSPGEWSSIMGDAAALPADIEWIADWSVACDACPTTITTTSFGAISPTIWQFSGSNCGYDRDFATMLPE